MKELTFKNGCESTVIYGRQDLFQVLKYGESRAVGSDSVGKAYLSGAHIPRKYSKCMNYIGGFVSTMYFVKSEIEKLSESHLLEFLDFTETIRSRSV